MNAKTIGGLAALAGFSAVVAMQHRVIASLQDENNLQRDRIVQLTSSNLDLSNEVERVQHRPFVEPSAELLRLRGQLGVLNRELQEASAQPTPVITDQLRTRVHTLAQRLRTLSQQLERGEYETQALLQAMEDSGVRDPFIGGLLPIKQQIDERRRLGVADSQNANLDDQAADMQDRIDTRLRAVLLGLSASLSSMDRIMEDKQNGADALRLESLDGVERLLDHAEQIKAKPR